jgi:hypothetical protein
MPVSYFSLAPAVILLLSAFVLSFLISRLPDHWQNHQAIRYFLTPSLVGLVGLLFLGIFLTSSENVTSKKLDVSAWNFSAEGTGASLAIQTDEAGFAFLILTSLILFIVVLTSLPLAKGGNQGWVLTLGASTYFLFISAGSSPTLAYTVLIFDLLSAFYWLTRKHSDLSIGRLFLGILTASALTLQKNPGVAPGTFLLGLALWLRLGLYPFIEITVIERRASTTSKQQNDDNSLAYWSLSLAVGIYLAIRTTTGPLPEVVRWLVMITMLLNGLLAWLAQQRAATFIRLAFTLALPPLFIAPLSEDSITAYTMGLTLSLAALWVTPQLGRPQFPEISQSWPYLPAVAATFTLIGLPLSLSWLAWTVIYATLFSIENIIFTIITILALALALSGLVRYWLILWSEADSAPVKTHTSAQSLASAAAIVAAVPFLIPGLAPLILSVIMKTEWPAINLGQSTAALIIIAITVAGAIGLGHFRPQILNRVQVSPSTLAEWVQLGWLLHWLDKMLNQVGKMVLRVNVILEGQHYIGWALFTALVGGLIIILQM